MISLKDLEKMYIIKLNNNLKLKDNNNNFQ